MVQASPELPLMHDVNLLVMELEHEPQRAKQLGTVARDLKDQSIADDVGREFHCHFPPVRVPGPENPHEDVDGEKPVGMHGTDIVQHVFVGGRDADSDDEEVHAEQHFENTPQRVVFPDPEEREIS